MIKKGHSNKVKSQKKIQKDENIAKTYLQYIRQITVQFPLCKNKCALTN